ncbi:hypothetical protein SEA_KUWABARA_54 [Gordonia phage Kuwabara]|nr:hypothetical protein SEA_KUWABARA_54 [Gordonia phage Kuwabara]
MTSIIDGEVVGNAPAILPPSKDEKVQELARLSPKQQVEQVTEMLVHSNAGLLVAIAAQDLPGIAEAKRRAATIQEIAKQVRMGKDMQLHAAEFCRRAERGLGVAIREGQASGTVETTAEGKARGSAVRDHLVTYDKVKPKPTDFASPHELTNTQGGIYDLADISDEQFEEVMAEAKDERNLSRANVARKAKAKTQESVAIPEPEPDIDAEVAPSPEQAIPKRRLAKHSSTEMLANIDGMLHGIVESLPFMDPADIDADVNSETIRSIQHSMASIRKLLKEITNG